jgi:DNA-binding GntR family transcriptional regulator
VYKTMTELAVDGIKERIFRGRYRAGERLMPAKLEEELGLGKMAIREALRQLAGAGLVAFEPNKGMIVAEPVSIDEIMEIFEIRFLLEPKATELAASRVPQRVIEELENLNSEMSLPSLSPTEFFFLNKEFHLKIYRCSGWNHLCGLIEQLWYQIQGVRNVYPVQSYDLVWFIEEHAPIIEALKKKQKEEVATLILNNIKKGRETLERDLFLRKAHL